MSPVEARQDAQPPEHGHHPATAVQARARYLQMAGGGLVAACFGTVTRAAEIRTVGGNTRLVFSAVADGDRLADEAATTIRVEYLGDGVEALAPRLVKGAEVYCEGRLTLNAWTGRDGAERSGLNIKATHIEVLGQARE